MGLAASDTTGEGDVPKRFRDAMRGVAATVALITTADDDGRVHGMSATAFTSVCMAPPLAAVCVNANASMARTLEAQGAFCINVLRRQDLALCEPFSHSDLRHRRFRDGDWGVTATGLPYLLGCQAAIVCSNAIRSRHGTHVILIADVVDVVLGEGHDPLVYLDGRFCAVQVLKP